VSRIEKSLREEKFPLVRFVQVPTQYAPNVEGKEIIIRSTVAKGRDPLKGVIMAQGNRANGYGLYVEEGKLHLVVRQNGKAYTASTTEPLPDKFNLLAQVKNNGAMSIEIDGKQVAKGKAPGLFRQPLDQGMRVSVDYGNTDNLGDYSGPNWLNGNMTNGFVQLQNPAVGAKASPSAKASAKRASAAAGKQGDTPPVTPTAAARTDSKAVGTSAPVPAVAKSAKNAPAVNITLKVVEHVMQYDQKMITVKAGQQVNLLFENPDFMQHNVLIIKPGTLDKVGAAADALARDPKGAEKHYVPKMPEVLYASTLVDPEGRVTLNFTAPSTPGDYPYVCTFPGHWRIMNGIMRVER
jgi:azurin